MIDREGWGGGGKMRKGSRSGCKSASHQLFRDKAKNRVDDLQGVFSNLQFARKESRTGDVAVLEEQVHQMLREWKAELNEASPASSLHGCSQVPSDLSSDLRRFLQLGEEEDDATSKLSELPTMNPKSEPADVTVAQNNVQCHHGGETAVAYQESYFANSQEISMHDLHGMDGCKDPHMGLSGTMGNCLEGADLLDYQQFNIPQDGSLNNQQYSIHQDASNNNQQYSIHQDAPQSNQQFNIHQDVNRQFGINQDACHNMFPNFDMIVSHGESIAPNIADMIPLICPPASAFLRPKCALWDCPRPAKGINCFEHYCSSVHAILAWNEGLPDMTPVLRPGGIDLKDGPLFAALTAKTQEKNVGIPECEGAATAKSPWNAPELFDLSVLEGESIREWLFFDKPRRAFESGNRKQRSLPDYSGRGWHESRKQVMKEFGGLKRSYYMDPQPLNHFEWHLYEYEINNCDACALYRLELKLVDPKKSGKGKVSGVSLVDLQQQMGKLNSDGSVDGSKRSVKGSRTKITQQKDVIVSTTIPGGFMGDNNAANPCSGSDQVPPENESLVYGPSLPYGYTIDSLNQYFGT